MAAPSPSTSDRPKRADARRNRDTLVAVARAAFAAQGGAASLEAIAREAGVGIGTLYRHFPTRDILVEAVYSAELDDLVDSARAALDRYPPDRALREWVRRYAEFAATKRGMMDTLRVSLANGTLPMSSTRGRITSAIAPILAAGAAQGSLRGDVEPGDVTSLLLGASLATTAANATDRTQRLLDLILDSLKPTGP